MSRKSSNETSSPGGSSLLDDFQSFCKSPALTAAFQSNPVAAKLAQQVVPASVPPVVDCDFHNSTRCLSSHLSKPFDETLSMFPDTDSTYAIYL